jgi:lipopolysaccharide/colanic/teichoic acid biosynthesis glycosyltransferase
MAMRSETDSGIGLTSADDERVTPIGRILRKFKLDELPQFYNVLRGEMSLVGPRPKLPQYEPLRDMPYRPGLTGAATLIFRREEDLLRFVPPDQIEDFYEKRIKFVKARVDVCAMCRATPISDLKILAATVGLRRQPSVRFVAGAPID